MDRVSKLQDCRAEHNNRAYFYRGYRLAADNEKRIAMHHDSGSLIDSDSQQFWMLCYYCIEVFFASPNASRH